MIQQTVIKRLAVVIALSLLPAACGVDGDGGDAPSTTTPASSTPATSVGAAPMPDGVVGRVFRVTGVVDGDVVHAAPPNTEVTLRIDPDQVSGSAGCNTYSAPIVLDGARIEVGAVAITERACLDTSDWSAFLETLAEATSLEQAGNGLVIHSRLERALLLQ